MLRFLSILGATLAVLLVAYAGFIVLSDEDADVEPMVVELGPDGEPLDERQVFEETRRAEVLEAIEGAAAMRTRDPLEGLSPDPERSVPSAEYGSGSFVLEEARTGFDHLMSRIEVTGDERRRLRQKEWQETYRAANDAYAALSMRLDPSDPNDEAELEQAHRRLRRALAGLRVRGRKFQ